MSTLAAFLLLWGEAPWAWVPWVGGGKGQEWGPHGPVPTGLSLSPAAEAATCESGPGLGRCGELV